MENPLVYMHKFAERLTWIEYLKTDSHKYFGFSRIKYGMNFPYYKFKSYAMTKFVLGIKYNQ